MHASFVELLKYLKLETAKGFTNKAIVGGFKRLLPVWQEKAIAEGADHEQVSHVVKLLQEYEESSHENRREIIRSVVLYLKENDTGEESSPTISEKDTGKPQLLEPYQPRAVFAPLTVIQGIGDKMAVKLKKLGLNTIYDLLHYYPRRYNDYSHLTPIRDLQWGQEVTISGSVQSIQKRKAKTSRMQLVECMLSDGTGSLWVTWFNQPWLTNRLNTGSSIVCSGKIDTYMGRLCLNNPEWEPINSEHLHTNRIVPVYPLTAGIQQKWLRERIFQAIAFWTQRIRDFLPDTIREQEKLLSLNDALQGIHFPADHETLNRAIERLSFDELFLLQLGFARQKADWDSLPAHPYHIEDDILNKEIQVLPYQLTDSQMQSLSEIRADLSSGKLMNRLLQGDVGAGKTVIARFAMEIVVRSGKQAAFLAPTALLAQQHYQTLLSMFLQDGILAQEEIVCLLGTTSEKEKEHIRKDLAAGKIRVIVGTHALLEDPIDFSDLQMVVIDEQHRFGVAQRAAIRAKGDNPHILIMSATPIPRSLNLTINGDLNVSTLTDMPGGRIPVATYVIHPMQKEIAYEKIRSQVQQGYQAFVVYPQIEGDEEDPGNLAVLTGFDELRNTVFPDFRIGLLHGKLKQDEKDSIMEQFRNRELDVLVSTTVIEVGMDIPNATIMLIEGANRFGLAQLHQLRGRVGRSDAASFCYLIPEEDTAMENERLKKMSETNDGFELAEFDLKTRGPGDFFGTRQSGYRGLKLASISDIKLITRARTQADELLQRDPDLLLEENQALRYEFDHLWNHTPNGELS